MARTAIAVSSRRGWLWKTERVSEHVRGHVLEDPGPPTTSMITTTPHSVYLSIPFVPLGGISRSILTIIGGAEDQNAVCMRAVKNIVFWIRDRAFYDVNDEHRP